jgi:hypothetical protein
MNAFFPLVLLTLDKTFLDEKRVAYPFIVHVESVATMQYMLS